MSTHAPLPTPDATGELQTRLVDEAVRLFSQRGYAATSIQHLVTACACSRPALYHYFSSKDELYDAALSTAIHRADILARMLGPAERFDEALRVGLSNIRSQTRHRPDDFRLLVHANYDASSTIRGLRTEALARLEARIHVGVQRGQLRPTVPVTAAAVLLAGTFHALVLRWLENPGCRSENDESMLNLFLSGVAAAPTIPDPMA